MRILSRGRGGGKTEKLIDWFLEVGFEERVPPRRYILCTNELRAEAVRQRIKVRLDGRTHPQQLGDHLARVITLPASITPQPLLPLNSEVAIDDFDLLLRHLLPRGRVTYMTTSEVVVIERAVDRYNFDAL